ncbi:hypothetical protein [Limnoglobus roseus]|uniref:hypothetical protein n=1 Tax=Limnoglobus roseus TaxID=2598579 RepID=UPI0011EAC4FE|nr:hypothetical protein [Limnoglobus roseus]
MSPGDWPFARLIWRMVLEMAIHDHATAVRYHPWRDAPLAYHVDDRWYEMVPPPPRLNRTFVRAAGAMLARTRAGALSRRWLGWPAWASGCVRVPYHGRITEWVGVVWTAAGLTGVDWQRIDDMFAIETVTGAGEGAA